MSSSPGESTSRDRLTLSTAGLTPRVGARDHCVTPHFLPAVHSTQRTALTPSGESRRRSHLTVLLLPVPVDAGSFSRGREGDMNTMRHATALGFLALMLVRLPH